MGEGERNPHICTSIYPKPRVREQCWSRQEGDCWIGEKTRKFKGQGRSSNYSLNIIAIAYVVNKVMGEIDGAWRRIENIHHFTAVQLSAPYLQSENAN